MCFSSAALIEVYMVFTFILYRTGKMRYSLKGMEFQWKLERVSLKNLN